MRHAMMRHVMTMSAMAQPASPSSSSRISIYTSIVTNSFSCSAPSPEESKYSMNVFIRFSERFICKKKNSVVKVKVRATSDINNRRYQKQYASLRNKHRTSSSFSNPICSSYRLTKPSRFVSNFANKISASDGAT